MVRVKPLTLAVVSLICGTTLLAQSQAPSGDITMRMRPDTAAYCEGPFAGLTDSDDITLRLPIRVWYESHLSEKVFLSGSFSWVITATVAGQNTPVASRRGGGGTKDVNNSSFSTIMLEKAKTPTVGSDLFQCLTEKDANCSNAYMYIPVLDRSKGLDLRGKTVEIMMTRDHSLAPDMVAKLKEKMKDYGTVFSGIVESKVVTFWIPIQPLTRNCPFGG